MSFAAMSADQENCIWRLYFIFFKQTMCISLICSVLERFNHGFACCISVTSVLRLFVADPYVADATSSAYSLPSKSSAISAASSAAVSSPWVKLELELRQLPPYQNKTYMSLRVSVLTTRIKGKWRRLVHAVASKSFEPSKLSYL